MLKKHPFIAATLTLTIVAAALTVTALPSRDWTAVAAQSVKTSADDRIYLKLDGVDGEATEPGHAAELMLRSFSWSEWMPADGKSTMKDLHVVMAFDKSSPILMKKSSGRERIAKATLTMRSPTGQDYLRWTLMDVLVTSFQVDGMSGQGKPVATFDLNAAKMDIEYRPLLFSGGLGPAVKTGVELR